MASTFSRLRAFKGMEILVESVLKSLPDMFNIAILLLIVLVILSVAAVNILGEVYMFASFGLAIFQFFGHLTLDGFVNTYDVFGAEGLSDWRKGVAAILMLINIVAGTFIFLNLIVAVAANTLEEMTEEKTAVDEEKKRQEEQEQQDITADDLAADINQNVAVTEFDKFHRNVNLYKFQKPIQLPDFKGLTIDKMEKYFLILAALDENFAEYKDIKSDLDQIYEIVKNVNVFDALEAAYDSMSSLPTGRQSAARHSSAPQKRSTLMASHALRRH